MDITETIQFTKIRPITSLPIQFLKDTPENHFLDPSLRVCCCYCQKIINKTISIKDKNTLSCVACFAKVQTFPDSYTVVGHAQYPILQKSWSASDEVLLLDSIEKLGLGNWRQISEYMSYFKRQFSQEQIRMHYENFYLSSQNFEPIFSMQLQMDLTLYPEMKSTTKKTLQNSKTLKIRKWKQQEEQVMGYNSRRQEFYSQYNSKLQKYIVNLQFKEADTEEEMNAKMEILQAYNEGLKNRYQIYDFIIEHRLLHSREKQNRERQLLIRPQLRKAQEMMKCFRKSLTYQRYLKAENCVQNLIKLQKLIECVRKYRKEERIKSMHQLSLFLDGKKEGQEIEKTPKKKVHKNIQNTKQYEQRQILKKLGLNKRNLSEIFSFYSESKNQQFEYRGIKVTILNPL